MLAGRRADLLDAIGTEEGWEFELRLPSHEALSELRRHCEEAGLSIAVNRIYRPDESDVGLRYGLTSPQYETLVRAVEEGYFDVPRRISSAELGSQFGISDQALTERIRRGTKTLVTNALNVVEGS